MSNANQPGAAWSGPGDPFVLVAGHLVSPQDGFGEIGRMANGDLRRPGRIEVGTGGIHGQVTSVITRFGAAPSLDLRRANGTEAAPTAVLSGEVLANFNFIGHDGVAFVDGPRIRAAAAENWAAGAHGAGLDLFSVPIGSAVVTNRWQVQAAGHLVAASDGVVDLGQPGANRPRDGHFSRDVLVGNEVETNIIRERTAAAGVTVDGARLIDGSMDTRDLPAAASNFLVSAVTGDSDVRFAQTAEGLMTWGPGNAGIDTNLFRSAANELKTDDNFVIGALSATAISVGINDSGGAGFKLLRVPN